METPEPVAARAASRVVELRKREGITQSELGQRLAGLGHAMTKSTISKIESGQRAITVEDLTALALALNASPSMVLLPSQPTDEPVPLTTSYATNFVAAWQWMRGESPLGMTPGETPDAALARVLDFRAANHPDRDTSAYAEDDAAPLVRQLLDMLRPRTDEGE